MFSISLILIPNLPCDDIKNILLFTSRLLISYSYCFNITISFGALLSSFVLLRLLRLNEPVLMFNLYHIILFPQVNSLYLQQDTFVDTSNSIALI